MVPTRTLPPWPDQGADALEQELLAEWRAERLFQTVQEARRDGPAFVFFEGPPTANGRPGIHHVFSRTIKDLFCRFRVMQGRSVTRIAGWDTHGLPVEIGVEKSLGLSGKKAIEDFGVAEFNRLSRESVFTYQREWEQLSDRIGYWLDYAHPYVTCTPRYIESVWWLLQQLHRKGLLSRGHRVLPYCPRCGTVLSSHELAQGYEKVQDKSVYLTFPLEDGSGRELLVWTTTPWTLPSNVAAAVHPDLEYGEYRYRDRRLILATAREAALADLHLTRERTFAGRELAGLRYRRPLDVVPLPDSGAHSIVVAEDFVTADEGSGIVHLAPAFGADDYAAGQRHGLPSPRVRRDGERRVAEREDRSAVHEGREVAVLLTRGVGDSGPPPAPLLQPHPQRAHVAVRAEESVQPCAVGMLAAHRAAIVLRPADLLSRGYAPATACISRMPARRRSESWTSSTDRAICTAVPRGPRTAKIRTASPSTSAVRPRGSTSCSISRGSRSWTAWASAP